ncbi:unnamed protein product [Chondrus crispus]|uniref:Uncharacterized protein n=1 Tax=Chondrus crispus TaxID=2769 RepID=R7QH63_CHOCR|nr:unnamed protein product [Chondrus crispus]CDF37862.1 unnamed protein product [Chondrus crispus]|eukprot:XP_005717733.1 unnamed protein product [Chondrus crispus]
MTLSTLYSRRARPQSLLPSCFCRRYQLPHTRQNGQNNPRAFRLQITMPQIPRSIDESTRETFRRALMVTRHGRHVSSALTFPS